MKVILFWIFNSDYFDQTARWIKIVKTDLFFVIMKKIIFLLTSLGLFSPVTFIYTVLVTERNCIIYLLISELMIYIIKCDFHLLLWSQWKCYGHQRTLIAK